MKRRSRKQALERSWAELCCFGCTCLQLSSWPKIVLRKWFNISSTDSDFDADDDEECDAESQLDVEGMCGREREAYYVERGVNRLISNVSTSENATCKIRRRNSETLRAQYINIRELRICVGTWNVGGKFPSDDLKIEEWLHTEEPADIYVLGLQEIVPLNAGNIFGAEDSRSVPMWESLIREMLEKILPVKSKFKCHSDPPSPSRFQPTDDTHAIEDLFSYTDSNSDHEVHPADEQSFTSPSENDIWSGIVEDSVPVTLKANSGEDLSEDPENMRSKKEHRFCLNSVNDANSEASVRQQKIKLQRILGNSERIGLSWPEQPLHMLPEPYLGSSKASRSFRACDSYKSLHMEDALPLKMEFVSELNRLGSSRHRWKRSSFTRIISKQMVGIFLTVWVRRSLRRHIRNLKVSTVGVGVMGYIGNKGSISVSMSIYQTLFCFVCAHLSAGEKDRDELRRNSDVQEIHRRTRFDNDPAISLPRTIHDHERIIWLGDLNYRINLSYDEVRDMMSKKEWSKLVEKDQLKHELKKGRAFDGWTEGILTFPPTYKYEFNSDKYTGYDNITGRRTPAWCDRILSFGHGFRLLRYERSELNLSDHRPVTAIFMAEVEVFCHRKLQRALTFTDAEVEEYEILSDRTDHMGANPRRLREVPVGDFCEWP